MKLSISFFSKRFILLFLVSFLFTNLIFTQEPSGTIRIKFKDSMTSNLKSLDNKPLAKTKDGYVKTGIGSFDKLTETHKVKSMKRVFRYAGKFETRHMKYGLHLWYELDVEENKVSDVKKAVEEFKKNEGIEVAEQIFDKELFAEGEPGIIPSFVSNDPMLASQWHYQNTGQTGGTIGSDIKLTDGWNIQKGSNNVIVAVIDGGIDVNHYDLNNAMWINQFEKDGIPGVDDDSNGYVDDVNGYGFGDNTGNFGAHNHGTHVGGTIGAISNNGIGVAGIAGGTGLGDGVRLMSCATFGSYGSGGFAEAFVYAADMGAVIAQNSWGYTYPNNYEQSVLDAIDYFITNAGKNSDGSQSGPMAGGLVVFAAGNDNTDDRWYPGYYDHVLSVASINHNSLKAYYSNYGSWVDISAPGGETIYSTEQGVLSTLPNNSYGFYQGTSMACPHVSGLAALIVSQFGGPGLTPQTVWDKIVNRADSVDGLNPQYAGKLGTGCINAFKSLTPTDTIQPSSITDLTVEETGQISATLSWTAPGDDGVNGSASIYDFRYATFQINEENFTSASRYYIIEPPKSYGEQENLTVARLNPATNYYFAIKAIDNEGNYSNISNTVQGETKPAPQIKIVPELINLKLNPGISYSDSLLIHNIGTENLNYSITTDTAATWLDFPSSSGSLNPGDSSYIYLLINTSGLSGGTNHFTNIRALNNDPLLPVYDIPLNLHINGIPIIEASSDSVIFGKVMSGSADSLKFSVMNYGNDVLAIDSVVSKSIQFEAACRFITVNPMDSANIWVIYKPKEIQVDEGELHIYSNDHANSPLVLHLMGESVPAPVIIFTPDSFSIELYTAQKATENLNIHNSGGSELTYTLEVQYENKDITRELEKLPGKQNSSNYSNSLDSQPFIMKCTGINAAANILLLEDVFTYSFYNQALQNLGLSRTFVNNWNLFASLFYSGNWDIVIINTYGSPLSNYSLLDSLKTYVEEGGKLIFATWDMEYYNTHPFINQTLGIQYNSTIYDPLGIHATEAHHPIFNIPNSITDLIPSNNFGNRDGQLANAQGNAHCIASFEGYPLAGSIVINSSNKTIFNAFQSENYNNDNDSDGKTDVVELIENEVSWLISSAWLKPALTEGQIQPGINQNIELQFDATGLYGGDYNARLNIQSNDPKNSLFRLPVHMHVQGAPTIEAGSDTLNFGTLFSSQSDSLELTISNKGTDILYANLVSTDLHFSIEQDSLILPAGASTNVKVTYTANEIMQNEGALTIISNDPSNPTISIILLGSSIDAPAITVTPDSFDVFLRSSETKNEILTISNSGGNDLIYQFEIQYENEDISEEITEKATVSLSNDNQNTNPALPFAQKRSIGLNSSINVLLFEYGIYYDFYNTALQNLGISRTQVTDEYSFMSQYSNGTKWDLIIINLYNNYLPTRILDSLYDFKGKIMYATWDLESHNSHPFIKQKLGVNFIQSITTPINFNASDADHPIFNYPNSVAHFRRTNDQAYIDGQIAEAAEGSVSIASYEGYPSSGSIILNSNYSTIYNAFQSDNFNSEDDGDGRIDIVELIENEISWLISSNWLKPSVYNGILSSGDSRNVDIEFNANLPGGDYYANVNILSNDPDKALLRIPAHLKIEGTPIVEINKDSLFFGPLYSLQTDTDTMIVSNIGTDTLKASIFTDNPCFELSDTILTLPPYGSKSVMIIYTGGNPGMDEGLLTISSNDSINPAISVILIGVTIIPASIYISPDSINTELTSGETTFQDLTIQNNGGSNLNISIDIVFEPEDSLTAMGTGVYQQISTDTKNKTNYAIQPSIEGNDILVIQDKDAWGFYMSTFIQEKFGIVPDVMNSSQIPTLELNNYKLIITTGDQSSYYYENISNNKSLFEDFVRQGGILQYQLATQGSNVTLVDNVNLYFGNLEFDNTNLMPGHPILEGLPSILHGSYANHCYFDTSSLPVNAAILTKTSVSQVPTTVEYSYGSGKVIATGMTWELYYMFDDSISVEWNACNYSISLCDAGWLVSEKDYAEINPGNSVIIRFLLNSGALEPGDYRANINISSNDPAHSVICVPVHLHINPDTTFFVQQIPFQAGWNIFSLNVIPDHISMIQIMQPLINSGILIKVQNETGGAIEPMPGTSNWIDNIGNWSITEGYKIRLTESSILEIPGTIIYDTVDIPLKTGWNIISYPFRNSQDAMIVLDPLILNSHLMKVQNENGAAIEPLPDGMGWINNIGTLSPGEGYKVRVSVNDVLSLSPKSSSITGNLKAAYSDYPEQHFVPVWQGNGLDHMNIYLKANTNLLPGDEIGVFDGEMCVGSTKIDNNVNELISIAVSADDPETTEPDGFSEGNTIYLKIWRNGVESHENEVEFIPGYSDKFEALGTTVAEISFNRDNSSIHLNTAYPNPFYEITHIPITIIKEANIDLSVYNLMGQKIITLLNDRLQPDNYEITWDGAGNNKERLKAGIYLIKLSADGVVVTQQIGILD